MVTGLGPKETIVRAGKSYEPGSYEAGSTVSMFWGLVVNFVFNFLLTWFTCQNTEECFLYR